MPTLVNDLMTFLNNRLGLKIPVLPLSGFPGVMVALWQRLVQGWTPADGVAAQVETDVSEANPLSVPIGNGTVNAVKVWVEVAAPPGPPSS